MAKLILFLLNIFDFFYKKKTVKLIKEKFKIEKFNLFIDVGAHHGETIDFFCKNFEINRIISFEASPKSFKILELKLKFFEKKFANTIIEIENLALGDENKIVNLKEFDESSSNTVKEIDEDSPYFKKKYRLLNFFKATNVFTKLEIKISKLGDYLKKKNIKEIDFLKIDTEGSEYDIIKGLDDNLKNIKMIYFEHHYDLMIRKDYKFRQINDLLISNNFKKVLKLKMPFRKVFEYIYVNEKTAE